MKYIYVLFLITCLGSCSGNTTGDLQKIIGTQMNLPSTLTSHIQLKDTVFNYTISNKIKLLVYYTRSNCLSCRLVELKQWTRLLEELDSVVGKESYQPLIVLSVGDHWREIKKELYLYQFTRPVLFDREGEFEAANLLPEDPMFHTFLLDKEGKVRLVGSPIGNSKMWELYKQTIKILTTENGCSKGGFFGV